MPVKTPRSAGRSRPAEISFKPQLRLEALEQRDVPATLLSTEFGGSFPLPDDAVVLGSSVNGRYFIYQSAAENVIENQVSEPGLPDIFWVDTQEGMVKLVSAELVTDGDNRSFGTRSVGVVPSIPGEVMNAVISADGRSVAFVSTANANRLDIELLGNPFADAGETTPDVFHWSADVAQNIRRAIDQPEEFEGLPETYSAVTLVSRDASGVAVGTIAKATNPSISNDGKIVAFVTTRNASAVDDITDDIDDNANFSRDVFRGFIENDKAGKGGLVFNTELDKVGTVTLFENKNTPSPTSFGKFTGFVEVDPLGRYMSGSGDTFVVLSNISPNKVDPEWANSRPGTVDVYQLTFVGGKSIPTPALITTRPGQIGISANGQALSAIIPREAPSTVIFAAIAPEGEGLVPAYVNLNGNSAELYRRVAVGNFLQPTQLITAAPGFNNVGANGLLDTTVGSYAANKDGTKIFFTSAATNLVTGIDDSNNTNDVFFRNTNTGVTQLISVTADGTKAGNAASGTPRPTDDGWLVAFESVASNLVAVVDTNNTTDIFVRDLSQNRTAILSSTPDNRRAANGASFGPVMAGFKTNPVAYFNSFATNLDPTFIVPPGTSQVYTVIGPFAFPGLDQAVAVSGGRSGFVTLAVPSPDGGLSTEAPFTPFPGYFGEIRVATADVTGNGFPDLIVAPGPGGGPRVKVINGLTGETIADFFAYEPEFRGGVFVAAGDFTGDGKAEIVVGAGVGGGPRVKVIDPFTLNTLADFFVYEPEFRGGVRVAVGDVDGDGVPDIVTAAGVGGGPRITVLSGAGQIGSKVLADFFAFEPTLRNGANVGVGDVTGNGKADIAAGAGPGGAPRVTVFDANALLRPTLGEDGVLYNFFAFPESSRAGVRVALKSIDSDNKADIITGAGQGAPLIRTFTTSRRDSPTQPTLIDEQFAFGDTLGTFGAFVG